MARVDKFVWAVRLFKTRTLAANQCKANKVLVNGESVKSSKEVKINDIVGIKQHGCVFSYKVIELLEKRVGAKLVQNYILDITPLQKSRNIKFIKPLKPITAKTEWANQPPKNAEF